MKIVNQVAKSTAQNDKTPDELYFNRELSWLAFNERVLEEAIDPATPLLDRLKFLSIFTSNLDEFFMVRVAGLKQMQKEGFVQCVSPDELPIKDVVKQIKERTQALLQRQYSCLQEVLKGLHENDIEIVDFSDLEQRDKNRLFAYFQKEVFPVLTPLAVDPSHPYPFLSNLAIYIIVEFESIPDHSEAGAVGFVEIPSVIGRLVPLEGDKNNGHRFITLENLVGHHLEHLFLGYQVRNWSVVRVTRNLDYTLLESRVVDLLEAVQKVVADRQHQDAVRLEVADDVPGELVEQLCEILAIDEQVDVYRIPHPLYLPGLMSLYKIDQPTLKEQAFNPRLPSRIGGHKSIFRLIRDRDLLVHHPYESFYAVTKFLGEAAHDENVLAIKQTLYRSSGDSPIIESLTKAAENGKQVTAVVELKARFDEKNNIIWARRLERAGVNVVYGFVGLKTHCKATMVVRREQHGLTRYIHLSTGNYNSQTAQIYTDIGLFTCNEAIGHDISALFNLLTGFNTIGEGGVIKSPSSVPNFKRIILAPIGMRSWVIGQINDVISSKKKGERARVVAKVNGLIDKEIIDALYKASQAGVEITLVVRGICGLRPKIPGLSENIRVISIVDRFLEHSRVYYFQVGKEDRVFLGSADWMTRSMSRRIEMIFPVEDKGIKKRLIGEILGTSVADNQKARYLQPDGSYIRRKPEKAEVAIRSQTRFIELAREEGLKSIPYEKAVRLFKGKKKGLSPVATKNRKGG